MNIAQLSEQLKDVPQNTLVGYAQNPNSVVPQFLALAEIQRRQQLQTIDQPPHSTVANDVLSQVTAPQMPPQMAPQQPMPQQLPENQPGVAQLPSGMGQGFASGGIVAFADGGSADDEEDEDREMAKLFPTGINVEEVIAGLKGLKMPQSYDAEKAKASGISSLSSKGSHPYEAIALDEAKKLGLDPAMVRHVLYKETGGHKDPATARSSAGAFGPMQLMPGTAKEIGVNIADPEDNTRGGVRYLANMMDKFKDKTLALAAYNAGPGRVQEMLKSGRGIESLKPETQNYVKYASGGEVKHFDGTQESDVKDDSLKDNAYLQRSRGVVDLVKNAADALTTPSNYDLYKMYKENIGDPFAVGVNKFVNEPVESQAERFRAASMNPNKAPEVGYKTPAGSNTPVPSAPVANTSALEMTPAEKNRYAAITEGNKNIPKTQFNYPPQGGIGPTDSELNRAAPIGEEPAPAPKSKSEEYFDLLAKDIEQRAAEAKASGDMNSYLALMQAGLGMMAGSSPYAMQNIGAGGAKGVETYAALKKQQNEAAKDIMSSRLGLAKYKSAEEAAAETRELTKAYREASLGQEGARLKSGETRAQAELAERMRAHDISEKQHANQIYQEALKYKEKAWKDDINNAGKSEAEKNAFIYGDPYVQQLAQTIGLNMSKLAPTTGAPEIGTIKGGYKFKGGNPNDQKNWEKV